MVDKFTIEQLQYTGNFHFTIGEDVSFYLTRDEVEDILTQTLNVFYVDLCNLIQFNSCGIRVIRTDDHSDRTTSFRKKELEPVLKQALETNGVLDVMPAYLDSLEKAKPNVIEFIHDAAASIANLAGIEPFLNRVRAIAQNSSRGFDDPVNVTFFRDDDRSLYFEIVRPSGKMVMNGGIIWHNDGWSIHT